MRLVSSKQFYLFLVFFSVITKFLYLPSMLSFYAPKDLYLVGIFLFLTDACFLFFVLKLIKSRKNTSFFTLLQQNLIKKTKNLAVFILFLHFFLKTVLFILETVDLLQTSFYTSFMHYEFLLLLVLLILYALSVSIKTLARTLQLLSPIFVLGLIILMVISFLQIKFLNVLPMLENGLSPLINAAKNSLFWYGDFLLLFLFLGRVELEKNFVKKSMFYYLISTVIVVVFLFFFAATFSNFGVEQKLSAYSFLQNLSGAQSVSKLDWLVLILWSSALLFGILLFCYNSFFYFKELFHFKNNKVGVATFTILLIATLLLFELQVGYFTSFLYDAFYVILFIQYGFSAAILFALNFKESRL